MIRRQGIRKTAGDLAPSMKIRRHFWLRYGFAIAATILVFVARLVLDHYFEGRSVTVIYVPAVVFAVIAGGRGPAIHGFRETSPRIFVVCIRTYNALRSNP